MARLPAALWITAFASVISVRIGDSDDKPNDAIWKQLPECLTKMSALRLEPDDLRLSGEDLDRIFVKHTNCSWWESDACKDSWIGQLAGEYFLRMTLVGLPDPGPSGPIWTRYTPEAQSAVLKAMRLLYSKMQRDGKKKPDLNFMDELFQRINIPDKGSWKVGLAQSAAQLFNRGSRDTLYRSKDVTSQPYTLSKFGDGMEAKIKAYNPQKYADLKRSYVNGLQLWSGPTGTSFVYRLPPLGIQRELESIMEGLDLENASWGHLVTAAEKFVRDFVVLHPYVESNGRTARTALNLMLMLNGFMPVIMERQDEDLTSSPRALAERICEGMVQSKKMLLDLFSSDSSPVNSLTSPAWKCCSAKNTLENEANWCTTVPADLACEEYGELKQSMRYLPWEESGTCAAWTQEEGACQEHVKPLPAPVEPRTLEDERLQQFLEADASDRMAGNNGTDIVRGTFYRIQSYSFPLVSDCNLASDMGDLVFMASYFHGSGSILNTEQEVIVAHEMEIKVASNEARANRHYIKYNDGKPDKEPKKFHIDTVGAQRGNKGLWLSLPGHLQCGYGQHPDAESKCAWRDIRREKTIHTACLMHMADDGLHGSRQVFADIYKKFRIPPAAFGEDALNEDSKLILKLWRKAFRECPDVWSLTSAFRYVGLPAPEPAGREVHKPTSRCCCFSQKSGDFPGFVKHGVCLADQGPRATLNDTWSMTQISFDESCEDGKKLYRIDQNRGRCAYLRDFQPYELAAAGGNLSAVTVPSLVLTMKPPWSRYVCDSSLGLRNTGCDCSWAGEVC